MNQILLVSVVAAIAGTGMVTGLLFAFSNFIMRALSKLPSEHGMFAMQQINEKIINPIFLMFFIGTPVLCALIALLSVLNFGGFHSTMLIAGSIGYLIGPFGITVGHNVPLNDKLAAVDPPEGEKVWQHYQVHWQRWNHIRTYIGLVSIILLILGLGFLPPL